MDVSDTIIAVSSPPGRSQRALLRLSGPDACALVDLAQAERGCRRHVLALPEGTLPVLALISRAPSTYTGDDLVELLLPGSRILIDHVRRHLHAEATRRSIRLREASPGEFTARAYFNDRLDLLQAEGIASIIHAETDAQLSAGRNLSSGQLGSIATRLGDELTRLAALVEAGIDFTDQEDVVAIEPEALRTSLMALATGLDEGLTDAVAIESLESVPIVVLVGRPNAGKSSLFNALVGRERTVVADLEGTTRDALREPLTLSLPDGVMEVMLVDVAGLGSKESFDHQEVIERAMDRQARRAIEDADLLIRCTPPDHARLELPNHLTARVLDIRTKNDLSPEGADDPDLIGVSAPRGEGLQRVREAIRNALGSTPNVPAAGRLVLSARHDSVLRRCRESIGSTLELLDQPGDAPAELLAATLRSSLDEIGSLLGRVTPDDILEHVFASFCVGK